MGGTPGRLFLCLFWRETKQRPELEISDKTGSGGEKRQLVKEPREGQLAKETQRGSVGEKRRRVAVENGQQKGPVKMS